MRRYAEIYQGFIVAFAERDDLRRPEYPPPRFAVRVDMLNPQPKTGDEFDGRRFLAPTRENPNLNTPPTERMLLEEILDLLKNPPQ